MIQPFITFFQAIGVAFLGSISEVWIGLTIAEYAVKIVWYVGVSVYEYLFH